MSELPAGFVLDEGGDGLPAGFVLDGEQPKKKSYHGSILPLSRDENGNVSFDSNAGLLGSLKSALTLPGDVVTGQAKLPSSGAVPGSVPYGDPASAGARVADLAFLANPVNPGVRAGDRAIPGVAQARKSAPPPTAQALRDAAASSYEAARAAGVDFAGDAIKNLSTGIQQGLTQDGIIGELAPKTFSILNKLASPPEGAVASLANLDAARKSLRLAAKDFNNPTEQLAASRSIDRLDQFILDGDASGIVAGAASAKGAADALTKARGNYAAAMRSEKVTGAAERADLNAAVAHSGANVDNATRQQFRSILNSPKQSAGFSAEELAKMEAVARGSRTANTARIAGNLLGGGGGLGAAVVAGIGGASTAPYGGFGAALPLVGVGAKQIANALTKRGVRDLDEMVRKRSPLYEENPLGAVVSPEARAALVRALLMSNTPQQ